MLEEFLKYLLIYSTSGIKFVFGPVFGASFGYSVFLTGTLTILGMMTTVYLFTYFGTYIRHFTQSIFRSKDKKIFTKKNRKYVQLWLKYGVAGMSFLTPVLLSPLGGAILVNAFGGRKKDIIKYMWMSSIFWGYPMTWAVKFAGHMIPFLNLGGQ